MISRSWRDWPQGNSRASAAKTARSVDDSFGDSIWRWSTATWCRKIKISASLACYKPPVGFQNSAANPDLGF
jgi:hypothetical protein